MSHSLASEISGSTHPTPQCEWLIENRRCTGVATTVLPSNCPSCGELWHTETCDWHVSCWFVTPFDWQCEECLVPVVAGEPVSLRVATER